jgi:hypothetical protein
MQCNKVYYVMCDKVYLTQDFYSELNYDGKNMVTLSKTRQFIPPIIIPSQV